MTGFKDTYFKAHISIHICYYRTCTQGAPWRACGGTRCQSKHHQCGDAWTRKGKVIPLFSLFFICVLSVTWMTWGCRHPCTWDSKAWPLPLQGHQRVQWASWAAQGVMIFLSLKTNCKPVFTWFSQYTLGQWPKSPAWYFSIICAIPRFVRMYLGVWEVKDCLSISIF